MQPGSLALRFVLVLLVAAAVWAGAASFATRLVHSRAQRDAGASRVACALDRAPRAAAFVQ